MSMINVEDHESQIPELDNYQKDQEQQEDVVMATRMTARKARNESIKLLFQTFLILTVSVGLILVIIFYVIPYMIRFAGNFKGISLNQNSDTIPPLIPSYSVPYVATNSASMTITGFAEAESNVILVLNGSQSSETVADSEGVFSLNLDLETGENSIAIYAKDQAENESTLGKTFSILLDNEAPELEWNEPEDGKTITNLRDRMISILGKTESTAKVSLNDRFVFLSSDGTFDQSFQLSEGENILKIRVTDQAGNSTEAERKIYFKP